MNEYIKQKKIAELIALKGKINIDYDWETEEKSEINLQSARGKFFEK
jgi:hypothetical protein